MTSTEFSHRKRSASGSSGATKHAKASTGSVVGASDTPRRYPTERRDPGYSSFNQHSQRKNNCFVEEGVCEVLILRGNASEEKKSELSRVGLLVRCREYESWRGGGPLWIPPDPGPRPLLNSAVKHHVTTSANERQTRHDEARRRQERRLGARRLRILRRVRDPGARPRTPPN